MGRQKWFLAYQNIHPPIIRDTICADNAHSIVHSGIKIRGKPEGTNYVITYDLAFTQPTIPRRPRSATRKGN